MSDHRISLDASHEAEISFNAEKRQKKLVEASVHPRTPTGTPVRRCPIAPTLAAASLPPPANPQSHIKYQSSCWGSRQDCLGSSQKPTWRPPRRSTAKTGLATAKIVLAAAKTALVAAIPLICHQVGRILSSARLNKCVGNRKNYNSSMVSRFLPSGARKHFVLNGVVGGVGGGPPMGPFGRSMSRRGVRVAPAWRRRWPKRWVAVQRRPRV